jgi:hypothetical protein
MWFVTLRVFLLVSSGKSRWHTLTAITPDDRVTVWT